MSGNQILDYAQKQRVRRPLSIRRILYCISLPLMVFGFITSLSPGDRLVGSLVAAVGAFVLAMALPVRD
jgi:hypothetical protein